MYGNFRNYFVFDGKKSTEFGLLISGVSTWTSPEFDVGSVSLPGRNGDLLNKHGRMKNATYTFKDSAITSDFHKNFPYLKDWMLSHANRYYRLEDSYHPDTYLRAAFSGNMDPDYDAYNDSGLFDIQFNVQPQRWLIAGEKPVYIYNKDVNTLFNPTLFEAKPLLYVYMQSGKKGGTIRINDRSIKISESYTEDHLYIDCDTCDAYLNDQDMNKSIEIVNSDREFPVLPGNEASKIQISGNITRIDITPRWWRAL